MNSISRSGSTPVTQNSSPIGKIIVAVAIGVVAGYFLWGYIFPGSAKPVAAPTTQSR